MSLTFVEACLFAFVAALHFGFEPRVAGARYAVPFLYPAAIVEALLALALLVSLALPGGGSARAGRVMGAQILVVIGIFVREVALLRGVSLTTAGSEIFDGVALVLALASIALVASPLWARAIKH